MRPLSANRKTPVRESLDPDGEASAVMAALKAENEQASQKKMQVHTVLCRGCFWKIVNLKNVSVWENWV